MTWCNSEFCVVDLLERGVKKHELGTDMLRLHRLDKPPRKRCVSYVVSAPCLANVFPVAFPNCDDICPYGRMHHQAREIQVDILGAEFTGQLF